MFQYLIYLLILAFFVEIPIEGGAAQAISSQYVTINNKAQLPFLNPDLAKRQVYKLKLANEMEVYLISDPIADKSGAAISVQVGSWNDPPEYPGMAHFLEHMLFLGTKKYPEESEYQRFILEHGGNTNAFTSQQQTSYIFSVNNDSFPEALSRFSEFFKEPLFNPSGVSRELQIIDQEYASKFESDDMRSFMVEKELANPKHPYHNFSIGNSKTLSKVSQANLKEWYEKHYSANLMRLVIYSSLPMEQLIELVLREFKDIPNRNLSEPTFDEPLSLIPPKPHLVYIDSIKNERTLQIIWNFPKEFALMHEAKPDNLFCYLFGHEGEGSLLAQLKRENLADKLSCGSLKLSTDVLQLYVEVDLTDEGVEQIEEVIRHIFSAIATFKKQPFPAALFDEIHSLGKINYQYQPRQDAFDFLMQYAAWGRHEPFATYPEQTNIISKFDPAAFEQFISYLTPERARFYVVAPVAVTNVAPTFTEKWMQVKYGFKPVNERTWMQWQDPMIHHSIAYPETNPFIPSELVTRSLTSQPLSNEKNIPTPSLILDDEKAKVYFASDRHYLMPQICWIFEIKTPEIDMGSPIKVALIDLYIKCVKENLKKVIYPAKLAGLNFEIERKPYGLSLSIEGYSQKAEAFFDEIIQSLRNLSFTDQEFNSYKETLRRKYQNFSKQKPWEQAFEYLNLAVYKKYTTEKQKSLAINRITPQKFKAFSEELFKQVYLQGTMYGEMDQKQAERILNKLLESLKSNPYAKGATRRPEVIVLSEEQGPYSWEVTTKTQGNAVLLAVESPKFNLEERGAQQVLMQAMQNPFFATLRTKQQTGYTVFNFGQEINKQLFDVFGVQSNTHSVRDLLARFELFIESFLENLSEELPEEKFSEVKSSIIFDLKQPPKTISEMNELLYKLAFEYEGDFNWISKRIKALEDLEYEPFTELVRSNLGKSNHRRIAILLKGSQKTGLEYSPLGSLLRLKRNSTYSTGIY